MLWSRNTLLTRRNGFPGWSWLGWFGTVNLSFGYAEAWKPDFDYETPVVDVRPLVDWYATDIKKGSHHLIDNSYHQHNANLQDPTYSLPEGWNKTWNEEHEAEAVQYEGLPNHSFRFPFLIFLSMVEDTRLTSFPYLNFKTQSCRLRLDALYTPEMPGDCLRVALRDDQNHWAGILESPFTSEDEYSSGTQCELIVISQGRAKRKFDVNRPFGPIQPFEEMDKAEEIKNLDEYVFINVLWIEWIEDIAYRKAMGRVREEVWNRQNVKTLDVMLE